MNDRCKEEVVEPGGMGFHSYRCSRKAVKDGYCKQHHPDSVKEREAKSMARWEEKRKKEPWYVLGEVKEKLAAAEAENNDLKAKVAHWEEKARQWLLSDDAKKQLDGYREMGDQIAALRAELEAQEASTELHANINRAVAKALGQEFGESWHDLGEKVAALKEALSVEKGWVAKYRDAYINHVAEIKRANEKVEKYHQVMEALKRSKMEHGRCNSPGHKACTRCMAEEKIANLLAEYKGRDIVLASKVEFPDERTMTREQVQETLRGAGIDIGKVKGKLKDLLNRFRSGEQCSTEEEPG